MWHSLRPVLLKRQGVALGVWGDAGVGKSYQVRALLQSLACRSSSFHAGVSLATLARDLLRPEKLPLWAAHTLARLEGGEALGSTSVTATLGAVFAGLAPFVLHLEDVHEADSARQTLTRELAQVVLRTKGAGLIVTSRRELLEPFAPFQLLPLSELASCRLLGRTLGVEPLPEAADWIYRKAAGNPLYTLEYLRYLTKQGFLWSDGKYWHWRTPPQGAMPTTVEALISQLVGQARMEPRCSELLEARALLPRDATTEVWSQVARVTPPELQLALKEFSRQGLFRGDDFAHPLFREVTLKTTGSERKCHLARRALTVLKDTPEQAAHFIEDATLGQEKTLTLLTQAAQSARKNKDELAAGRLLAKAVSYAKGEARGRLALSAACALENADVPFALSLAEEAAQHLGEPAEALYLWAALLAGQGEVEKMHKVVEQLPREMLTSPAWPAKYIRLLYLANKDEERISFWEGQPEAQTACSGETANFVAWGYLNLGRPAQALELINRVSKYMPLSAADRCNLLEAEGATKFYGGDYGSAEACFSEAFGLRQLLGSAPDTANVLRNRSVARLSQGRFRESLPDLEHALAIYSKAGKSLYYAETLIMMSYVLVELGDYERTETVLLEALELFRRAESQPKLVDALAQLTGLYLDWSAHTYAYLALRYAREAEEVARPFAVNSRLMAVSARSRAETEVGNPRQGLACADKALELALSLDILEAVVNSHYARGLALYALGRLSEAGDAFTRAYGLAEQHGLALEAAKCGLELDHLHGDLEGAKKRLAWFEERGLINGVDLTKRYFPALAKDPRTAGTLQPQACLNVLGPMQLRHEGKVHDIRGRKRQELLAVLLEARLAKRAEVSKLELLDTLYGDEDELRAVQSLKTLVHSVRRDLGDIILTTHTGYSLGHVTSDAERFLETAATTLWRGVYLEGAGSRLETVQESLYLSLFEQAERLLGTEPQEAARVARLLLEADPYNTQYLVVALKALRNCDNYRTLGRVYDEARVSFAELGERLPKTWTVFLELQASR